MVMARRLAREEGLFAGTSRANVVAAVRVAKRLGPDATVVTIVRLGAALLIHRAVQPDLTARPMTGRPLAASIRRPQEREGLPVVG